MHMSEKEFNELIKDKPYLQSNSKPNKKNKYHNTKIWVYDGIPTTVKNSSKKADAVFDSKKEYNHWVELCLLQQQGVINNLSRQKEIVILPDFQYAGKKVRGIKYKADFFFTDEDGKTVVEDTKPYDVSSGKYVTTKDFNLKWKLLMQKYPEWIFRLV